MKVEVEAEWAADLALETTVAAWNYTVGHKKGTKIFLSVTLSKINRF